MRRTRRQSDLLGFYPLPGFGKAWDNFLFSLAKALGTQECFVTAVGMGFSLQNTAMIKKLPNYLFF